MPFEYKGQDPSIPLWRRYIQRKHGYLSLGWRSFKLLIGELIRRDRRGIGCRWRQVKLCTRGFLRWRHDR